MKRMKLAACFVLALGPVKAGTRFLSPKGRTPLCTCIAIPSSRSWMTSFPSLQTTPMAGPSWDCWDRCNPLPAWVPHHRHQL